MSEWLTTGEMIDQLKDGETAKSTDGKYKAYWHHGLLKFIDKRGNVEERIIKSDQKRKWIIVRYVSFEEAMKALMNGKTVWLWKDDKKRTGYYIDKENGELWSIVGELAGKVGEIQFASQWTIED
jgi:hypothetical protein